ncbi:hypothetical protein EOK75_20140 (plasmid) [Pseudorhodobacter turbinis]|uniref:VPLPA-CTERM sorting domain-containing protein n=1 Tax=Pseudorhodobacter turbinis TaxID=2500533 RepID=A0A4P8ELH4_9RHOB|nr:hypothetical protein [Pseudorhodobacter turbinis]QCO58141.1 hypothetical protein EOK75_20140 [Pseudorhodobacter turbinis]
MKLSTSLKSFAGAIALTAVASIASAATTTYADFTAVGNVTYTDNSLLFGFPTGIAGGEVGGTVSANLYGDTATARDYTLEYSFDAMSGSSTDNLSGAFSLPFAFSIDSVIASLPTMPSTGGGILPLPALGAILNYSGLAVTSSTVDSTFTFQFVGDAWEDLLVSLGSPAFPDDFTGTYVANLKLVAEDVAPVPLPAAAPLLFFGVGGLVAFGRKRRKTA